MYSIAIYNDKNYLLLLIVLSLLLLLLKNRGDVKDGAFLLFEALAWPIKSSSNTMLII